MSFQSFEEEVIAKINQMGIQTLPCRNCGREIIFLKTTSGRLMPVTLNLESHFIDCPGASKFRRRDDFDKNRDFPRNGLND